LIGLVVVFKLGRVRAGAWEGKGSAGVGLEPIPQRSPHPQRPSMWKYNISMQYKQ